MSCEQTIYVTMTRNLLLLAEGASVSQLGLSSGRLAQDGVASNADDDGRGVREDGRNLKLSQ